MFLFLKEGFRRFLIRERKGFVLLELQLALALIAVLGVLLASALGTTCKGWLRIGEAGRIQSAGQYMLAQLERDLTYDGAQIKLITSSLTKRTRIDANTIYGNRSVSFVCDGTSLYKKTKTNRGVGSNPVFIPGIKIIDWQVQAVGSRALLVSFVLEGNGLRRRFQRLLYCVNGSVDAYG